MVAASNLAARLDELPDPLQLWDVYRKGWSGLDRPQTERALEVLIDLNHIAPRAAKTGGRPTTAYAKNPALSEQTLKKGTAKTDKSQPFSIPDDDLDEVEL